MRATPLIATLIHSVSGSSGRQVTNHLLQRTTPLTQSYYALRHGQSLANVQKIISSDPAISTVEHGLSDEGKRQATKAGETFAEEYLKSSLKLNGKKYKGVAIFSSDFTRARETATLFAEALKRSNISLYNNNDIVLERRLRERYFGELNGGPDNRYQEVWDVDVVNPNHEEFGVESANSVLERTSSLIVELDELLRTKGGGDDGFNEKGEKKEEGCWKCVLVAHGDVLQIMQTGFLGHEDASRHRSLEHLETATVRELSLVG
eukprot:CAMPEP_0196130188 /NCGR_PEP_ID=MMETSP0910-20130528/646_1 /TAXON_ID=49265 /ORGANISM="Thalassiosira rotula, Strain GSO102" /LENGTH=262 /DNA_ID=CAMNT_0041389443 /DNA_START=66 /DNA_END=854 /DNA_ORIENTATION=+